MPLRSAKLMDNGLIYPEIFKGGVVAFFTDKTVGVDNTKLPLPPESALYMPIQKHTATVIILRKSADIGQECEGDAVITDRDDVFIGVRTADCVPIMLYDAHAGVVAAVHAGWRGTAKGILKAAINSCVKEFGSRPEDLSVAIGPSIRGCCYIVGADVVEAVISATGGNGGDYVIAKDGGTYVNLANANTAQALSLDVRPENIWTSDSCTLCQSERFHSYRKEGTRRGSQGAFIGLRHGI
ncbi:MAG: peptidoglycan editing factor PgeF [Nitrospirae bacterium]|nr:peptidoglycan editing factor PgeF [Nitrospirota bacterium]